MTTRAAFNPGRLILSAILFSVVLSGQSMSAHEIQIVEYSSTKLTVTWDGSATGITVTNTAPDQWTVTGLEFFTPGRPTFFAWREPDDHFRNLVSFYGFTDRSITVISDGTDHGNDFNRVPDGARVLVGLSDPPMTTFVYATFHDVGVGDVPDTGNSFTLLSFSLIVALGASGVVYKSIYGSRPQKARQRFG